MAMGAGRNLLDAPPGVERLPTRPGAAFHIAKPSYLVRK